MAAVTIADFPGGDEYPVLGETGSKVFFSYLVLNIVYGCILWVVGTLFLEEEQSETENETSEAEQAKAA
ncbi:MAG: hypothetical protein R3C11_03695 [Planctomycetaceae bacterium]